MAAGFTISKDTVSPLLKRLAGKLDADGRRGFVLAWGHGVATQAMRNARGKGGRRFWRDVARSIAASEVSDNGVLVFSSHVAAAQKQYGGDISAPGKGPYSKGSKALTIPFPGGEADTVDHPTATEFALGGHKLFVLGKKDGERLGVLGYADGEGEFHPLFILRKRVSQKPEPFFPDEKETIAIGERMAAKKLQA